MTVRIPGSLISRALRSRLVAAQQQRIAGASTRRLGSWPLSTSVRPYSAPSTAAAADTPHEDDASTDPAPSPAIPQSRVRRTFHTAQNTVNRKLERDLLMAIASSSARDPEPQKGAVQAPRIKRKVIEEELKWLSDPRSLGNRVSHILQNGDPAKAAAIVREALKRGMKCEVAWNHLLEYCLGRGQTDAAFRFYNDMKKRGLMPNSRTYTTMLAGLSRAPPSPMLVKTAHGIYESISAPNSKVDRSIIHTNAMLSVCHRHCDMDMLWRIAADMPEEGSQAPDMTTYTIILHAIQFSARDDIQKMSANEVDKILDRKAKAVREGKKIWADVLYRWGKGHLQLDNNVVSTMASVLLDGASDHDCYDVLRLYNQTMGIPILQGRPPDTAKSAQRRILSRSGSQEGSTSASQGEEDVPFVDETNQMLNSLKGNEKAETDVDEEDEEVFWGVFDPVSQATTSLTYPKPNNKDLTFILDACFTMTQAVKGGIAYWKRLTLDDTEYRIEPDAVSSMQYLRLLRLARASKVTVQVMQQQMVPSGQARGKAFVVAMSTCRRDRRNHSVLLHANELLALMGQAMILPDPRVLLGYLELIQVFSDSPQQLLTLKGVEVGEGRTARHLQNLGKKLQVSLRRVALAQLRPHIDKLQEAMERGTPPRKGRWSGLLPDYESVPANLAVKVMARTRLLVDEILKSLYMPFVSKQERIMLERESMKLRKYSDQKVIELFRTTTVHPTLEHREAFNERQRGEGTESQHVEELASKGDVSNEHEVLEASQESELREGDHETLAESPVEQHGREA